MADGKKRDSETAWFLTLEKAQKEAKVQKENKEKADRHKVSQRRDKKLITAYEEFVEYLEEIAKKELTNTDKKEYKLAKAILNNHMPEIVGNTKIKDITIFTFRSWISHINSKDEIGGGYIRLCRQNLTKFNAWLSANGYYLDEYQEEAIDIGIRKTKIKKANVNNREELGKRKVLSIVELQEITRYYIKKEYGLGEFRNFYFYTLFFVLFYSGVRVEELAGLQWKFIDLREGARTISIKNAISRMERAEHALERTMKGQYRLKNNTSIRTIPIFDFYYDLLVDYKESFGYQYGVSKEEIEECFVFPNISKNNPHLYMRSDVILRELKKVLEELNIEPTDLQMFRHSCATFLILPPPDGMGYTEEKVKDYFGHHDTTMLTKIYARLNSSQKTERMRHTFGDIFKPDETAERSAEEKMKEKLLERIGGRNEREKYVARKYRIFNQIKKAEIDGKREYYYLIKDKGIIEEYIKQNGSKMKFVEEED
jgi:integrase